MGDARHSTVVGDGRWLQVRSSDWWLLLLLLERPDAHVSGHIFHKLAEQLAAADLREHIKHPNNTCELHPLHAAALIALQQRELQQQQLKRQSPLLQLTPQDSPQDDISTDVPQVEG